MQLSGKLESLLENFLLALLSNKVEFLVIGGVAVNHYGYSRTSNDIDLWYNPTLTNYERIIIALKQSGQDVSGLNQLVFDPKKTYLRLPLDYFKIEMLPLIHSNMTPVESKGEFKLCLSRSEANHVGKAEFRVIGYDDLIRFKKISGRPKDLLDVLELERLTKGKNL